MNELEHCYLVTQGLVIRGWRVQLGMTQEELAAEAQISRTEEQYIETARRNAKPGTLKRVCAALHHAYGELVTRVEHLLHEEAARKGRGQRL